MTPNSEQRAAIESTAAITVVAAGPGSGKTQTLAERVRARVAAGVNPKRIVILTFTNAGAWAFTQRLQPLVLGFTGTLHGYCMRLLQAFGGEIGYRAGSISIVTEETRKAMLLATAKRLGVKCSQQDLFDATHDKPQKSAVNLVWNEYRHELKRSNMIDYSGILFDALKLLKMPCELSLSQHRVDELYVDEVQDSAGIDWEIYHAIPAATWFFIGDQDQSIFGWRGARPELFLHLAQQHVESTYTLTHNYRSDIAICEAATRLISHNTNRIIKPVVAVSEEPGSVTVVEVENDTAEIFQAYKLVRESGVTFRECAILCRTNALALRFRTMMVGFGVQVKQSGAKRLPEDWSFALSAIGLLIDPSNNHHAEQLLRAKGLSQAEIETRKLDALRQAAWLSTVSLLPNTTPATLGDALTSLAIFGISDESMELIRQRVAVLPNENPTLSDLLADLWNNDRWNVEDEGDGITVTTIHGAKGKEWDFVLVPAMEEGILPSNRSDIEEERRLAFVGITRARHTLVLMHAKQRTAFYKTTKQEPSRFLQEIK